MGKLDFYTIRVCLFYVSQAWNFHIPTLVQGRLTERIKTMMPYIKRAVQVVVLTAVLVFCGLLVVNTGFVTKEAQAIDHTISTVHELIEKYHYRIAWDGTRVHYDYIAYYDHIYYQ